MGKMKSKQIPWFLASEVGFDQPGSGDSRMRRNEEFEKMEMIEKMGNAGEAAFCVHASSARQPDCNGAIPGQTEIRNQVVVDKPEPA
jgi:hypothetical protein